MRKFSKMFLIISGIIAALGIALIIVGISMGGSYAVADDVLGGRLAFGFGSNYFKEDSDTENMSNLVNDQNLFAKEEINSLALNGKYGEYEIDVWDNDNYAVQGIKGTDKIKYSVEDGVLKVSMTSKKIVYRGTNVKAKILVPRDAILNSITLNMTAGALMCNNIKVQSLDVNIGAGEGDFNNIEAVDAKFKVGAGDGGIKNSRLTNCDIDVGMGDFDVEGSIDGNVNIDCGMGNVELALSNLYSDFNYTVKVGAGDVEIGEEEYSGISNSVRLNNNSNRTMDIDCGLGDVSVEFGGR